MLFFTLVSCEKDIDLFDSYSSPISNLNVYHLESMSSNDVNDILFSLVNEDNFHSSFDEDGITYDMIDKRLNYDISYCYHIIDRYYSGTIQDIHCDNFICLNTICSLYTQDNYYICKLTNVLIFNVDGQYYQVPYTISVTTDLYRVVDVNLLFIN